jgi:hypothetical protein
MVKGVRVNRNTEIGIKSLSGFIGCTSLYTKYDARMGSGWEE